jgi:hypothetical protein
MMNLRYFILAMVVTLSLITVSEAMADNSMRGTQKQIILEPLLLKPLLNDVGLAQTQTMKGFSRTHYQETQITIDASRLDEPHNLIVRINGATQVSGHISVNGVVIHQLIVPEVNLDLSPYLSSGPQTVAVSATYRPGSSAVQVTFTAPNSNVVQQTSGSGLLNYRLHLTAQ